MPAKLLALLLLLAAPLLQADECAPYRFQEIDSPPPPVADSFLLKITLPDLPPSYLLGTLHSAAPEVLTRWSPAVLALSDPTLRVFITERDLSDPGESGLRELPAGETLAERLADQAGLYPRVVEMVRRYRLPVAAIERWRPWFAAALLSQAPALPRARGDRILDAYVLDSARELSLEIRFLETFAAIATIYQELDPEEQLRLLWEAVCNQDALAEAVVEQTDAYAANDVAALHAAWHRHAGSDPALSDRLGELFGSRRNAAFWRQLEPEFARGGVFVAVGALHVFGEGGLLERLLEAGMTVRPVDPDRLEGRIDPARLAALVDWTTAWLEGHDQGTVDPALFSGLRIEHQSLPELRQRLCPGRDCLVETSYLPETETILVETGLYVRLLVGERIPQVYAQSLLLRELTRHALYRAQGVVLREQLAGQAGAEDCLRSAILHQAAMAQQIYLSERGSARQARPFVRDPRCPDLF